MKKRRIGIKEISFLAILFILSTTYFKSYAQERKFGIGIEIGVSSLGDKGTDEYGYSHERDKTSTHFSSGKRATFDLGFSFQFNRVLLNFGFPIDGSVGESSYGKGELTENLSGVSMNAGYEFKLSDYFYVYPLVGFSIRANKYSDLYYGEVATGESRTYLLYGGMIKYKSFYLRGNNDGVSLGYMLELKFY